MSSLSLISVRVKPEIAGRLKLLAAAVDRSSAYLAAEAVEEYLDIHEWQVAATQEGIAAVDNDETVDFEKVKKQWLKKIEDQTH